MLFKDSFRAQYFLLSLEREIQLLLSNDSFLKYLDTEPSRIFSDFASAFSIELDQILLPTVVHELSKAKSMEKLSGINSHERYASFFVSNKSYTDQALNLPKKYPFLFEMIDEVIKKTFCNLKQCLSRFEEDCDSIKKTFLLDHDPLIREIKLLSTSDRHRNQQAILLMLSNEIRLIYKPVDLRLDRLFEQFLREMNFPFSFELKCRKVLPKDGYGWLEYIFFRSCDSSVEIATFYQRMGVLLAVADALNFTDGHCENIFAYRDFPFLLDCETLFQNYAMPTLEEKSILSTHLIQKLVKKTKKRIDYSALQAIEKERFESLFTYALNDHTDEIQISYSGYRNELNHNRPSFNGKFYNSFDYVKEIIEGYCHAYDHITQNVSQFLKNDAWWDEVGNVQSRMVIRDTSSYFYLLRKIQQPGYCISKKRANSFIKSKLGTTPYSDYEVQDILELNIPYFYHLPKERHLYDGSDRCYPDVFPDTAINWIKKQLIERNENKKQNDCNLIRKYLQTKN